MASSACTSGHARMNSFSPSTRRAARGLHWCSRANRASVAGQRAAQAPSGVDVSTSGSSSVLRNRFMIPASEVQEHLQQSGLSMEQFLTSLIRPASLLARPPISGYHVGSAGLGASGAVYVGVNLEFPGAPLNNSVHSEQFLVVNCLHNGEESIKMLAVSAAPCGHCRQFYTELYKADEVSFLFGSQARPRLLDELLPGRFGPQDLSPDGPFPLLLQSRDNRVAYSAVAQEAIRARPHDESFQQAAVEALHEARKAYSPYTHSPSGAAIITQDGRVFSGGCIENAAYNPSMSPFHTAYIAAVAAGAGEFEQIRTVVLAEVPDAPVQHKHNVQLLFDRVAPAASLTILDLQRGAASK